MANKQTLLIALVLFLFGVPARSAETFLRLKEKEIRARLSGKEITDEHRLHDVMVDAKAVRVCSRLAARRLPLSRVHNMQPMLLIPPCLDSRPPDSLQNAPSV